MEVGFEAIGVRRIKSAFGEGGRSLWGGSGSAVIPVGGKDRRSGPGCRTELVCLRYQAAGLADVTAYRLRVQSCRTVQSDGRLGLRRAAPCWTGAERA